jgi:hypothetical protein
MDDDEDVLGDGVPLDLVTEAGDGVLGLLGGGLGVVGGDVVGDLCGKCQYEAGCRC